MTKQIVLRAPPSYTDRRQPLLSEQEYSCPATKRVAEVVGGTTAECAAICCCCPCGLVNLLVLAVYKVPAGLCRKALRRKRRRKLMKKGLLPARKYGCDDVELVQLHPLPGPLTAVNSLQSDKDVVELEKEMWDKFYSAGFWRSASQNSDSTVPDGNDVKKAESHMTSAAAFVEGGVQEACDDSCSICLEAFSENDPSTVTTCKHEFHLQCILEWCQRSSNCPMCWQTISLKDPASQELLDAVEREKRFRFKPARNATVFHHPTLGDFELQHLPVGVNDAELEERIIHHLAAAAAMGRARRIARREGSRAHSSAHGRPHFLVFSTNPNAPGAGPASASVAPVGAEPESDATDLANQVLTHTAVTSELPELNPPLSFVPGDQLSASSSGSVVLPTNPQELSIDNRSLARQSPSGQDRAGPSDLQTFSESWKSRFNAISLKYKESLSKNTRGWKERLFSRSNSVADIGSEVRREVSAGIASVSRMMERLETRENSRSGPVSASNSPSVTEQNNHVNTNIPEESPLSDASAFSANSI
ncbi:hypothetical protein ACH5RR_005717 [Cinchona calisaya]|uniref:RING-type domain-containing protein n=1 Tax=Cinchona calisaya TaxID=153742 RepID=A0ABD3AM04_9GENT